MEIFFKTLKNKLHGDNKNIVFNSVGALLIKGGGLLLALITMPAYMEYFNDAQVLGFWFTLLSVLSWILAFDLGIGNGLRNKIVFFIVKKDYEEISRHVSTAYFSIGVFVAVIIVVAAVTFPVINWNSVFNISSEVMPSTKLSAAVTITFSGIMLRLFLGLISSILYALQKSALTNFMAFISNFFMLLFVLIANRTPFAGDLILMASANAAISALPPLIATVIIFSTSLKESRPRINGFDKSCAAGILQLGGMFFWIQLAYMLITTTNEFLITWLSTPDKVVDYQIYNKLFTLAGMFFAIAMNPIWSAVTKAVSEKKYDWLEKLYNALMLVSFLAIAAEFAIIPFLNLMVKLWLGHRAISINYSHAICFAFLGSCFIWNGMVASFANGMSKLKVQNICYTVGVIIKFPLAWLLCKSLDSWIGIIWANVFVLLPFVVVQHFVNKRTILLMKMSGA